MSSVERVDSSSGPGAGASTDQRGPLGTGDGSPDLDGSATRTVTASSAPTDGARPAPVTATTHAAVPAAYRWAQPGEPESHEDSGTARGRARGWSGVGASLLSRWWVLPVVLGLLGALVGGLVGLRATPSAEATLEVQTSAVDGTGIDRAVQTAVVQLGTEDVLARAAQLSGVTSADLRSRTEVAAVTGSQIVSVTVRAQNGAQAQKEANAITSTAISTSAARVAGEIAAASRQARYLIVGSRLPNVGAEQARVAALGAALASRQSDLISGSGQLSLVQPAQARGVTAGAPLLAAIGLLGGVLVGLAVSILLGTQRNRITSAADLRAARPDDSVLEPDDLGATLALGTSAASTVVVAGLRESVVELQDAVEQVTDQLALSGYTVTVIDVASLRRRTAEPVAPGVRYVLPVTLNHSVVREVRANLGLVMLVVVRPRRTRLEWLDGYGELGERSFLLMSN